MFKESRNKSTSSKVTENKKSKEITYKDKTYPIEYVYAFYKEFAKFYDQNKIFISKEILKKGIGLLKKCYKFESADEVNYKQGKQLANKFLRDNSYAFLTHLSSVWLNENDIWYGWGFLNVTYIKFSEYFLSPEKYGDIIFELTGLAYSRELQVVIQELKIYKEGQTAATELGKYLLSMKDKILSLKTRPITKDNINSKKRSRPKKNNVNSRKTDRPKKNSSKDNAYLSNNNSYEKENNVDNQDGVHSEDTYHPETEEDISDSRHTMPTLPPDETEILDFGYSMPFLRTSSSSNSSAHQTAEIHDSADSMPFSSGFDSEFSPLCTSENETDFLAFLNIDNISFPNQHIPSIPSEIYQSSSDSAYIGNENHNELITQNNTTTSFGDDRSEFAQIESQLALKQKYDDEKEEEAISQENQLREKIELLQKENEQLRNELQETKNTKEQFQQDIREAAELIIEMCKQKDEDEKEKKMLRKEKNEAISQKNQLHETIEVLQKELEAAKCQLKEVLLRELLLHAQNNDIQKENEQLRNELQETKNTKKQFQQDIREADEQITEMLEQKVEDENEKTMLKKEKDEAISQKCQLRKKIKQLQKEIDAAKGQLEKVRLREATLHAENDNIQKENVQLRNKLKKANNTKKQFQQDIGEADEQITEMLEQKVEDKKIKNLHQVEILNLKNQLIDKQEMLAKQLLKTLELSDKFEAAMTELRNKEREISELKNQQLIEASSKRKSNNSRSTQNSGNKQLEISYTPIINHQNPSQVPVFTQAATPLSLQEQTDNNCQSLTPRLQQLLDKIDFRRRENKLDEEEKKELEENSEAITKHIQSLSKDKTGQKLQDFFSKLLFSGCSRIIEAYHVQIVSISSHLSLSSKDSAIASVGFLMLIIECPCQKLIDSCADYIQSSFEVLQIEKFGKCFDFYFHVLLGHFHKVQFCGEKMKEYFKKNFDRSRLIRFIDMLEKDEVSAFLTDLVKHYNSEQLKLLKDSFQDQRKKELVEIIEKFTRGDESLTHATKRKAVLLDEEPEDLSDSNEPQQLLSSATNSPSFKELADSGLTTFGSKKFASDNNNLTSTATSSSQASQKKQCSSLSASKTQ